MIYNAQMLTSVLAMRLNVCPILRVPTLKVITPAPVIMALLEMASTVVKVSCGNLSLNYDDPFYTLVINECIDVTHNCDRNALCTDNVGSFACTCVFGYTGTGEQCSECDHVEAKPSIYLNSPYRLH